MEQESTDIYANLNLREQLYLECRAMTEYVLARGQSVPASVIKNIEAIEDYIVSTDEEGQTIQTPVIRKDVDISDLVDTHDFLSQLIEPASPKTILLLDMEQKRKSVFKFLSPVALVRQLMVASFLSLLIFVALMASPYIDGEKLAEDVLSASGLEQLLRLMFYMSSAGLGASFAALYKANFYIAKGSYDPTYEASYWIRFSLGIIAGLLLALLISERSISNDGMLSHGVARPLLAILGGFSADLLYSFLNRMVETFKSLFESNARDMIDAKELEGKAKLANMEVQKRMQLAQRLMDMQQQISTSSDPEEVKQQLNDLVQNLIQTNRLQE